MRWFSVVCLILAASGCRTDSTGPATEATTEARPAFRPGPAAGELFEGQIRIHTRGAQGDALGCDCSPLGDLLAYSWNDQQEEPKIFVVPTQGGLPRQVTFGAWADMDPEFAPADDPARYRIAYASRRDGNFDIYLISLAGGGGAWQITGDPADEVHPTFSPDGRHVAFARLDADGVWKIWRKDLTTQQETYLGPGTNPEWSPTGAHIAFQLPAGRDRRLWTVWLMRDDGSERTQLVADSGFGALAPAWSPDGRFVAVTKLPVAAGDEAVASAGDIWAFHTKTGASFKLTTTASLDADPTWGLDGWIFFSSTRTTGRFNITSGRIAPALLGEALAEERLEPLPEESP
jgi:TolB protein